MLDAFHNIRFPLSVSLGARGGPIRRTEIVTLSSGHEKRIARWAGSRRRFNAGLGVKCPSDAEEVVAFFEAREGQRFSFRWRDPFDHRSAPAGQAITATDQALGVGDGAQTVFEIYKTYPSGSETYQRRILLPLADSVLVSLDGVALTPGSAYTVDDQAGTVTFTTPPPSGGVLTCGFIFDIPARFESDELVMSVAATGTDFPDIPIVEVLS